MTKLDFTALNTLERCEAEFTFRHVRHLVASAPDASPHFGQIVHVGVRALWKGESVEDAQRAMKEAWLHGVGGGRVIGARLAATPESVASPPATTPSSNMALAVAARLGEPGTLEVCDACGGTRDGWRQVTATSKGTRVSTSKCDCLEPSFTVVLDATKPHLSLFKANAIVAAYNEEWHPSPDDTQRAFDCVWNEGYAESATECGLPDRAVRSRADGLLYAMDLKTTGMALSREWMRSFEHSQQAAMQLDLLEAEFKEPLAGFWLDAIRVPRVALRHEDFARHGPLAYSPALRAELREQRAWNAQRANDLRLYPQAAKKSPGACLRYSRLCNYYDVCRADPEDRETLVQLRLDKGEWKEERWVPSER